MKFFVKSSNLKDVLLSVLNVVPAKTTLPILGNILFTAKEDKLYLSATDLEVTIKTFIPVKIEKEGGIALPAKIVGEIIRQLPDTELEISVDENNRSKISFDLGRYVIAGENESEFPEIPKVDIKYEIEINSNLFERMIRKTIFAVSSGEVRSSLIGVYLQLLKNELRAVSTDGHRLVKIENKSVKIDEDIGGFITSSKSLYQFLKNKTEEGNIKISVSDNYLVFKFDNYTVYSRLIEGTFPDYDKVIPKNNNNKLIVEKDLIESSIRRVSIFANKVTQQIKLKLTEKAVEISSEDVDYGKEGVETIPAEYDGEEMTIGYNSGYILDILEHIDTEKVILNFDTPTSAGLVFPTEQNENESILMLVMPIKLSDEED